MPESTDTYELAYEEINDQRSVTDLIVFLLHLIEARGLVQGVPKVRSHLTFANKTGYIARGRVYYRTMFFQFMARHFATRCGISAARLRSVAQLMLAHAELRGAVSC